jgi:hypothetical protein
MPFTPITLGRNRGKYKSPTGRIFTGRQIKAYYATKGFKRPVRSKGRR